MSSFDERAARAADVLAAAWPAFVSYAELERQGIERPAQTVYELEIAGYRIEHSARRGGAPPLARGGAARSGRAPGRGQSGAGAPRSDPSRPAVLRSLAPIAPAIPAGRV